MAKTLVALYDTFTTAEHVVQELIRTALRAVISISPLIAPRVCDPHCDRLQGTPHTREPT